MESRPFIRNRHVARATPEYLASERGQLIGEWLVSDRYSDGTASQYAAEHCGYTVNNHRGRKWVICTDRGQYLRGRRHHTRIFSTPLSAAIAAEADWQNNVVCGAAA